MKDQKYKTPKGASLEEVRAAFSRIRKRKPSRELLEALKQKPKEDRIDGRVASEPETEL